MDGYPSPSLQEGLVAELLYVSSDSHKQGAYFSHSSPLDRSLLVLCVVQVQELALLVAKLEYRNTVRRSPEATKCEHTASVAAGW